MNCITYLAGGMLGDFIYELSVIKTKYNETGKKGILYLSDKGDSFRFGLINTFNDTYNIITSQEYIEKYQIYNNEIVDIDLTLWRWNQNVDYKNWYNKYSETYNIKWGQDKWLYVTNNEKFINKVIINTTDYRWPIHLDFSLLCSLYSTNIVFVSSDERQYHVFKEKTGLNIEYYKPTDFNDLCSTIHACKLFVGSQSAPLHIAVAMKKHVIIGECIEENHSVYGNHYVSGLDKIFPNISLSVTCYIDSVFDWKSYVNRYEDLHHINNKEDAWHHWIHFGQNEGRHFFTNSFI